MRTNSISLGVMGRQANGPIQILAVLVRSVAGPVPAVKEPIMAIKIEGTPFVLPEPDEAQQLVQQAFDKAKVPVQDSWVNHQKNRVVKKLEAFLECLGPIGVTTTSSKPKQQPTKA